MPKPKITHDEANRLAVQLGYFDGLHKIIQDYDVSKELGARIKVMLFKHILFKVQEAKKEIVKLQAAVAPLEAACHTGMVPRPAEGHDAYSATVMRLRQELKALDGWTISLLESDVSLLCTVQNPETAGIRVNNLRDSFAKLFALRWNGYRPFDNYPDLFNLGIYDRRLGVPPPPP